ncbi:hypothetical protein B7494_g6832 [Chlorociboria aeruginascens]|nr:hypothetical protein B7494_g6832 [Chlorociboria aeruginascens]
MTELGEIFEELGISHYLDDFVEQGFDTWETILDITESDFDALGVKLGHRRKLQRKIANSRGLSSDQALASPNTPSDDRSVEDQKAGAVKGDSKDSGSGPHGAKRKYRRHPKSDENAPERPPSAYVIFSNKMREDLKGRNLSFTEIAKLVGENWQNLSPAEKEPYEQQAFTDKDRYNNELAEYKKTQNFRDYAQYLAEFKARQANQQQVTDLDIAKRPKLEAQTRTTSSGTTSSGTSQHEGDAPGGSLRLESPASASSQWLATNGQMSPSLIHLSNLPTRALVHGRAPSQASPKTASPPVLPGYRDSMFGGAVQSVPRREGQREDNMVSHQQLPRISNIDERRSSQSNAHGRDTLNPTGTLQHSHRTEQVGQTQVPPLLTSESSASNSSAFLTPRTPMEPSLDRALPMPSLYPQSSGSFDHHLPPLRPPSLSPQSSVLGIHQFPNSSHPGGDFQTSIAPIRGYAAPSQQYTISPDSQDSRLRDYPPTSYAADAHLDPVSALLKAGDYLDRGGRGPPPP